MGIVTIITPKYWRYHRRIPQIRHCFKELRAFTTRCVSIIYFRSSKSHFFYFTYQFYKTPLITLFILHYIILKYHKLSFFIFSFFFFSSLSPPSPMANSSRFPPSSPTYTSRFTPPTSPTPTDDPHLQS